MNPAHRDGWPPTQATVAGQSQGQSSRSLGSYGPNNASQQLPLQTSPTHAPGPVLPPPTGAAYYSSAAASLHNQSLPGLMTQSSRSSPHQIQQRQPASEAPIQHLPGPPGPPFSLPAISQTLQQQQRQQPVAIDLSNADRDRELHERETREREMESHGLQHTVLQEVMAKRETEQRDRELHEQQQREQAAIQNHPAPIQIHQPVAMAPSTRTVHGPNGLLGQVGPIGSSLGGPNTLTPSIGGPSTGASTYGNGPSQHDQNTSRMQHAVQSTSQAQMLIPFPAPPGAMSAGQGQQPILNDALSYLDQVKVQFADHPDVYNQFLDIMKDFKSGAIDTPGVIERVSTLFAGNPNLIQGFNTFLPPGYKIECGTNGDPNAIRVTTPMGTMVSTMPTPRPVSPSCDNLVNGNAPSQHEGIYYESAQGRVWPQQQTTQGLEGIETIFSPGSRNLGPPLYGTQQGQPGAIQHSPESAAHLVPDRSGGATTLVHQQEQRGVSQLQNAVSAAANRTTSTPGGDISAPIPDQALNVAAQIPSLSSAGTEKRAPVEFNHAISYVNKIKNRFSAQPDIYKQFLDILQTYQRESKPIQDVYAQVTTLFGADPDLLEDFKQFLPESAAQHRAQQQAARHTAEDAVMLSNVRGEPGYGQNPNQQTPRADPSRLPPMGNFAPTPTANRDNKRKRERQGPVAALLPAQTAQESTAPSSRNTYGQGNATKRTKTGHIAKQIAPDYPPISPTLTPALPEPMPPTTTTSPSQDELAFFDRVKKFIGNKNTMNEFLKLCNLFSQDLIDKQLLIYRAQSFIGGNQELFTWFKNFMGEDEEQKIRPKIVSSRVSLSNCRSLGPSYRLLPKRERERVCGGRDELCRSVLNDEWASHPTWASEDSGFVAHRKNTFEEGLHRIEEERHDYDYNIEACTRTIQQLEPIANQLLTMKIEERTNFTLPPGLGGQSETIYKRVIMKIYGREKGKDVIKELFAMPWSVVPVLLHRLKTKLEDWKAAQREWEKVWRDQTQKIFWKSLDHQSITVKQADKRQFQPKSLTNEIQVRYEEQKRLQTIQEIPQPDYQFSFAFKDEEVLFDVARLMLTFAENNNVADFAKVIPFIKEFIPLFFGLDVNKFEQRVHTSGSDSPNDSGEDTPSPDEDISQRSQKVKKRDLRRGVLDPRSKSRKDKEDSIASVSRDTTPELISGIEEEATGDSSTYNAQIDKSSSQWVEYSAAPTVFGDKEFEHEEPYCRSEYNLYANASIYCFFRMFELLYERLLKLKESEEEVQRVIMRAKEPKAAHRLKMLDKQPEDFFKDTSSTANYYQQVLDMFQDQILGEMDMNFIEETLRRYYLQIGWQLYSFDRLLSSLVRFALAVVSHDSKDKTLDIYNLFRRDRVNDTTTHKAEIGYRKAVEKYAKDTDTYRITYDPAKAESFVRLFKKGDPTFEFNTLDRIKRWRAYVASYIAIEPTEEIDVSRVCYPYLKKRLAKTEDGGEEDRLERVKHSDKITVSISPAAYIMTFINSEPFGPGGVQYFLQPDDVRAGLSENVPSPVEGYRALNEARRERAQEILTRSNAWMKDMKHEDVNEIKASFENDLGAPKREDEQEQDVEMEEY